MSADTSDSANALLAELSNTVRQAATDVVWLQWRALGAQTATRGHAQSLVDPEVLVLTSLTLSTAEPRLRDVLTDWVVLNASLLSVQRFKNLNAQSVASIQPLVGAFARLVLTDAKDVRWRSLARDDANGPEFTRRSNKARARDAAFDDAAALWLRLRLALSVGIKADTMAFLLGSTGAWASGRAIANATSYTLPAVRRAVEDLSQAGLVVERKHAQKAVEYSVRHQPWAEALGLDRAVPVWRNWHDRFTFVTAFLAWAEKSEGKTVSRYAFGALGRELLDRHASAFDEDDVDAARAKRKTVDWPAAVERAVRHFARRLVRDA
jgi:biotin operon repressor